MYGQGPDTLWTRTYGGERHDLGFSIQRCDDGYIIAGWSNSFGPGDCDAYLLRINNDGDTIWTRTCGGAQNDYAYDVFPITEGYIVCGTTESLGDGKNVYLFKVDTLSNLIWSRTFGGEDNDEGYSVQQTRDNGFIIAGWTWSYGAGNSDVYLIKTDSTGAMEWSRTYGGVDIEYGYSVKQTQDKGFIIVGLTCSYGAGGSDIYLIRTDSLGDTLWTRTYGRSFVDAGYSVAETRDNGFIISGSVTWSLLGAEMAVIKTDSRGNIQWEYYNGSLSDDTAYAVKELSRSGYITVGNFSYELYLIRIDDTGTGLWSKLFGGAGVDVGYNVLETPESGYIIVGATTSFGAGNFDVYVIKTDTDPTVVKAKQISKLAPEIKLYPNPFKQELGISFIALKEGATLDIYNVDGRRIMSFNSPAEGGGVFHRLIWDGRDSAGNQSSAGVYFVRLETSQTTITRKVVKIR